VRRFIAENLDSSGFSPGGDPDGSHNVGGSAVRSIRELRRERGLSTVSSNGRSAPSVVMSGGNLSISSSLDRVPLSAMLGAPTPNDMLMLFDESAVQRHAAMADEETRPDAPAHSSGAVTVPKRPSHVAPDAEGSLFAMKILFLDRKGPEKRDQLRQRAEQEIECLRKSQCPLVVSYISHKFTENTCELVMQLVDGGDLEMQIKKRLRVAHEERRPAETYSEEEALFYFVQACVAARSLHRRNILHRDIKSGNFLCSSNGLLKLADFGFSKDFSPHGVVGRTVCSDYLGTPAFMAPEIWRGDAYGDKAEVWSLGIVLYQLLTLEFPFNGSTSASLSRRICRGTYLPTNAARQHGGVVKVSEETQDMIHWMLSVDQTQRPTLDELLASRVMRHAQERFITFYNHVI
jgi:serine/threonine protein kinase